MVTDRKKKKWGGYSCALFLFFLISGCLGYDAPVTDGLVFETEDVSCPADVIEGELEAEIVVTSNRSWSLSLGEDIDWVALSDNVNMNPTGVSTRRSIIAKLERNDSYDQRSVVLNFKGEGFERQLTLVQKGKVNRLDLSSGSDVTIACEPSEASVVSFRTNASWKAYVGEGATAEVVLDKTEGKDDGEISVSFSPNYSITENLTASVFVEVDGLEPMEVKFTQEHNEPFIRVDNSASITKVVSIEKSAEIVFHANADWTAKVLEGATLDLTLSAQEGTSSDRSISLDFDENKSEDPLTADIEIRLKDYDVYKVVTVSQRGGLCIIVDFAEGNQPFVPEIPYGANNTTNITSNLENPTSYTLTQDGKAYEFIIGNHGYNTGTGDSTYHGYLLHGRGYIGMPVIEGKRLVEVHVLSAATNKRYCICEDTEGAVIVTGGALGPIAKYTTGKWILTDTLAEKRYCLYSPDTGSRIVRLTIVYE